jgi:plastocyanin
MKRSSRWLGVVVGMAGVITLVSLPLPAQESGDRIDITIKNFGYHFPAVILRPDQPVTIRLRNNDTVEHGFTSSMLSSTDVQVETAAGSTFGRGINGVHILPGQELSIHLLTPPPGQYSFKCDLHPEMKGELFLFSVGTA